MPNKLDLSKLSIEERQELYRLIAENETLKAESFTKDQIIKTKDDKIKTLNATISELTKVLIKEKEIVKKYNLERYFSKADRPITTAIKEAKRSNGLPSTVKVEKKKPGRQTSEIVFSLALKRKSLISLSNFSNSHIYVSFSNLLNFLRL